MSLLTNQVMGSVNFTPRSTVSLRRTWSRFWLFLATTMIATVLPSYAVTREITITAPTTATENSKVNITVAARTDAGGGEQIGFFHADYSTDGGTTWTAISYSTKSGQKVAIAAPLTTKAAGAKTLIRVRVAFRGGKSGDVDYTGKAIDWNGTWNNWQEPPAKIAAIAIVAK